MAGSSNDAVAALGRTFAKSDISPASLAHLQSSLRVFVNKHNDPTDNHSKKVQEELRRIWQEHVEKDTNKLTAFLTCLVTLEPYLRLAGDLTTWFDFTISTVVDLQASKTVLIQATQDLVLACIVVDTEAVGAAERQKTSLKYTSKLVSEYLERTRVLSEGRQNADLRVLNRARQALEEIISAVGQKRPQDLFDSFEKPLLSSTTRYSTLRLMASWLKHQHAHIYRIIHTSIIEILLKCLMNDRSTAMISVALQCLLMLLPHIPVTVSKSLPRLFLIYSRCLCWEKFSASASQAQKDLVTDERLRLDADEEDDHRFSIDPDWDVVLSVPDAPDSSTPELLTYFTYLYGLYPLNFLEYIKKPRKYLKQIDFPGAEEFDLDTDIIHKRTEPFQSTHLLHPNLFRMSLQDELEDNRWLKAEPSEVVAECLGLYIGDQPIAQRNNPAFGEKVSGGMQAAGEDDNSTPGKVEQLQVPPQASTSSLGLATTSSGTSAMSVSMDSMASKPSTGANDETVYLQREILVLRSELNFEQYMKQQHVSAIGQMKRDRIKAVTVEAETGSLLNSNKTLQKKLDEAMAFNVKIQQETQSRKIHARRSEDLLNGRIRTLRATLADQSALEVANQKANEDIEMLRQLLVESEAKELASKDVISTLNGQVRDMDMLRTDVDRLKNELEASKAASVAASTMVEKGASTPDSSGTEQKSHKHARKQSRNGLT